MRKSKSVSLDHCSFNKIILIAGLFLLPTAAQAAAGDAEEQVYLMPDQALKLAFPRSDKIAEEKVTLTAAQKSAVQKKLGWRLKDDSYLVHKGITAGKVDGYAVITEEIGKRKPITFLVKVTPDFQVERVDVLVYREPHGSEVRREGFLSQFKGKSARDGFRPGRDVVNITGATLSVQAMSGGVKRVLCILEEVYGRHP